MLNIQKAISVIPSERVALASAIEKYSYGNLVEFYQDNIDVIDSLRGSSVAINGRDRIEFAILLSILDGYVDKILFLPSDIDTSLHKQYYNEVGVHFEVYLEDGNLMYHDISQFILKSDNNEFATQWIIPTSGTTNIPKLVSHSFESLTRTTKKNLSIGEHFRWGLVFDIYRFSGIQVFLQSILAGSMLIITDASQSMSKTLDVLVEERCNALSATPSFWRKVLMSKESDNLKIKRITLGGEISDENILQALKIKFPDSKISHIYASTEVGVGFSVIDGHEGFPKSYLDGELENIKMKIDKDCHLWISPSKGNQSYVSKTKMYNDDGYINTGDLVELREDRVYFLGRASGAINVGGNKVQPEEVESTLVASGLVSASFVYAMKNSMMGSLVCADVVLLNSRTDKKEAKAQILKYCRDNMERFKVPAILKFVKELQTTLNGKLKRETR